MKNVIALLLMTAFSAFAADAPSIWGQVVKTKKELYGHEYFITFQEKGRDYAYPLAQESKVGRKKIEAMVGKYAKIHGRAEFEKAQVGESKYIMAFQVERIQPLTFQDLNRNMPDYADRLTIKRYASEGKFVSESPTATIDDKVANTAIMAGGAALAIDVLANILKGAN